MLRFWEWEANNYTKILNEKWPDKGVCLYCPDGSWHCYRYMQLAVCAEHEVGEVHYEYINGYVRLHFEGGDEDLRRELLRKTGDRDDLSWETWSGNANGQCQLKKAINNKEDLIAAFKCMVEIFDPKIEDFNIHRRSSKDKIIQPYEEQMPTATGHLDSKDESVSFTECSIAELMREPLSLPNYQREYCWEDKEIQSLWKTLAGTKGHKIHLGNIILQHNNEGYYDIIDGQQRLVTLTLMARQLEVMDFPLPLLLSSYDTADAQSHISNAKDVIYRLSTERDTDDVKDTFVKGCIRFGVLVLGKDTGLDLAYTFFNSQNSKGIPLNDHNLLKAHHLQYVSNEAQAMHLSRGWERMDHDSEDHPERLTVTLDQHLLRLRRWLYDMNVETWKTHIVRDEFQASPQLQEVPPFGESYNFWERFRGGASFFAWTEHFVHLYEDFLKTSTVVELRRKLPQSRHWHYASAIETLLFAYFIKFGNAYLPETLYVISRIMAGHRYDRGQARTNMIMNQARDSRLVMMIVQAPSQTFFLAEALGKPATEYVLMSGDPTPIQREMHQMLAEIFKAIDSEMTIEEIKNRIAREYE